MNKLKSAFSRHANHNKEQQQQVSSHSRQSTEETRSNAFLKKLEEAKRLNSATTIVTARRIAPQIDDLDTLSETERTAFQSWWKDLNPFNVEKVGNKTILQFVSGCTLPETKLEEVLLLFEGEKEGLTKEQFFAMLRLIAHAENGRKVSPEMVYLGAPLPRFRTQAIDVLMKRPFSIDTADMPTNSNAMSLLDNIDNTNVISPTMSPISASTTTSTMNNIPISCMPRQGSINPYPPHNADNASTNANIATSASSSFVPHHARSRSAPYNISSVIMGDGSNVNNCNSNDYTAVTSSSIWNVPSPSITSPYSVPIMHEEPLSDSSTTSFNSMSQADKMAAAISRRRHLKNSISMGSESLEEIMRKMDINNESQRQASSSLLLTQSFRPEIERDSSTDSDNIVRQDDSSNTVEEDANDENDISRLQSRQHPPSQQQQQQQHYNPFARLVNNNNESILSLNSNISASSSYGKNPFETDDSSTNASTPIMASTAAWQIPRSALQPPPVPPQSTKPAFPKYARRR